MTYIYDDGIQIKFMEKSYFFRQQKSDF